MDCNSIQYIVYAILSALVVGSEALGLTKSIPQNSIIQVIGSLLKIKKQDTVTPEAAPQAKQESA